MTKEVFISVEGGQIVNKTTFRKMLSSLKDGRYLCKVEKKNKRSNLQNRYIHGILFPELSLALKSVGYADADEVIAKEFAKKRFLTVQLVNEDTGEGLEYVKETSKLTTIEMGEFIENVIRFAAESLNYEIPFPNEQVRFDM